MVTGQPEEALTAQDLRAYLPVTELHARRLGGGFESYLIQASPGLRPDSYDPARLFLEELVSYFTTRRGCSHESFVQIGQTRDRSAAQLFADHARKWVPEMGLGVWPHRPAPRLWKAEDLEEMDPDTGMPPLLHSLYRVTAGGNARLDAMATITGTGCGMQLLSRVDSTRLLQDLKEQFLNFIQDRVFRIFPWYVPLLEEAALNEPLAPLAHSTMRSISLYIRESPEDGGILIVSTEPLAELLAQFGCEQIEHGSTPKWRLGG